MLGLVEELRDAQVDVVAGAVFVPLPQAQAQADAHAGERGQGVDRVGAWPVISSVIAPPSSESTSSRVGSCDNTETAVSSILWGFTSPRSRYRPDEAEL